MSPTIPTLGFYGFFLILPNKYKLKKETKKYFCLHFRKIKMLLSVIFTLFPDADKRHSFFSQDSLHWGQELEMKNLLKFQTQ
ncbi:hypothetical protein DLK05_14185 [Ancylomarina longa]|uniref:Uncharacterized protein n=1 Tax=Ancylomarina longa TaxID=2487017 RepID=A0A434AFR7_9BACT|nr:hypothetical protein DLK05_14185 [Ancylomarina longa]